VALNVAVEDVHDAATKTLNLIVGVEARVDGAGAVRDSCVGSTLSSRAIWSKSLSRAVKVDGLLLQVGVWALDALARARSIGIGIVEATKPESANISGEGPLTNPHVVLEIVGVADSATIFITVLADIAVLATPCEVLVGVHHYVLVIIILEQIVPGVWVEVEGVMEDELDVRVL